MIDSASSDVGYEPTIGHDDILNGLQELSQDLKEHDANLATKLKKLNDVSARSESLRQKERSISQKFSNMRSQLDMLLNIFEQNQGLGNGPTKKNVRNIRDNEYRDSYYQQQNIEKTYDSLTSGRPNNDSVMPFHLIDKELNELTYSHKLHSVYSDDFNDILHSLQELCEILPPTPVNIENINELVLSVKDTIETFTK